jgi:hypothetical protein
MANQITDGRTPLDDANANTNFTDLAGSSSGNVDTEIKIQGTGSVAYSTGNSRSGLLYNAGTAQDWSNTTFYLWVNCGIVGLLATKANGGLTVRFCGSTVTNWFEVYIAGSDLWPTSVSGGWTMFVVNVETARADAIAAGHTNGTAPATSAIQYVGISTVTAGTMPRKVDNTWLDAMWRLPASTAGIVVEGRNGGTTPWTWADVASTAVANSWGTAKTSDGGAIGLNTPVSFFVDDATTHAFASTNEKILWENQEFIPATGFYGITVLGASTGTANWSMGSKTGTGTDATGAQGGTIAAASSGGRWFFTANGANIDSCALYGVSLEHASAFLMNSTAIESVSCLFIDCQSASVANSLFLRNSVINAATADGTAFLSTDDIGDVDICSFQFSDGHAIELTAGGPATQDSSGNSFIGYGATGSNDAALYNNSSESKTINIIDGGTAPTYRNGGSADTALVINPVTLTVTVRNVNTGSAVQNAYVLIVADVGGSLPAEASISITRSASTATVAHTGHGFTTGEVVRITGAAEPEYNGLFSVTETGTNSYTYTIAGSPSSPATGSPEATAVLIAALTNVSGQASVTRSYGSDQPFAGVVRKGTSSTVYKSSPASGTVDSASGASVTIQLIPDN